MPDSHVFDSKTGGRGDHGGTQQLIPIRNQREELSPPQRSLDERLMRGAAAVSTTFPPREPARHGWADLLTWSALCARWRSTAPAGVGGAGQDHECKSYDEGGIA